MSWGKRCLRACFDRELTGNGYCDDEMNHVGCNFDGGDCCGPNTNTDFCIYCACLNGTLSEPTCEDVGITGHIGDGYCDDYNDNELCGYDGGDCCSN